MTDPLRRLLALMAQLRGPGGCPWDREQTFASVAPHTIEEAYEVADAIDRADMPHLEEELGDLLFQVVFHAQMAAEAGHFDFDAVAGAICDKITRRHPHVFADAAVRDAAAQNAAWEAIKADERAAAARARSVPGGPPPGELDGIPVALPALARAYKMSKRAARVGFDFEHAAQAADKVAEELDEVRAAGGAAEVFEEVGDLLFAAANLARKLGVDAEAALRAANAKFERRFRGMELLAAQRGAELGRLDLAAQERLWQEMKRGE
jgi:MazG family protein